MKIKDKRGSEIMINNIIKLFYSEVVKTKMSNMPNEDYELRDGCKKFRKITLKIDSYLFKGLKIILALFILYLSFHVKIYLGIGVLLVEGIYLVYKVSYEKQVKAAIENVKNNLKQNIYKTIIPRNIRLAEAPSHGLPINLYDKKSSGAEAYKLLAEEVINNEEIER